MSIHPLEQKMIKRFIIKEKRDRYISFLSKDKTRHKFLNKLYHFSDFDWRLFRPIKTNESESDITLKSAQRAGATECYIISNNRQLDRRTCSIEEIDNTSAFSEEGIILIFGDADVVYYADEVWPGQPYHYISY